MSDPRLLFMPLMRWWGDTPVGSAIRKYSALIALTQVVHLIGLTMLVGTLLILNLRLLGFGFVRQTPSRLAGELAPWTISGLMVSLISGVFILSSEAQKCYDASFFWIKMCLLAGALVFHFAIYRPAVKTDPAPGRSRVLAAASLALWLGVAISGKFIALYGDDLRNVNDSFQRTQARLPAKGLSVMLDEHVRSIRSLHAPGL